MIGKASGLLSLAVGLDCLALPAVAETSVTAIVEGVPSNEGRVKIILCTREGYEGTVACDRGAVEASTDGVRHVFENVAPGTYIVQAFHDANDNGKLDFRWLGPPREAVGTSNNPPPKWRRATFEEGAFKVGEEPLDVRIWMIGGTR